jgi:hypothetical protein
MNGGMERNRKNENKWVFERKGPLKAKGDYGSGIESGILERTKKEKEEGRKAHRRMYSSQR